MEIDLRMRPGLEAAGRRGEDGPLVSVALPVHNQRPYLEESVRSILAQTLAEFELVIGSDGSDDGSIELLRRLAAADSRIRLIERDQKSGLSASANWVVRETRAPFVAIAHGDDISNPDRLALQLGLLRANADVAAVGSTSLGIDPDGRPVQPADLWRLLHPSPFAPFAHSSVMFRRSAFEAVGGYREEHDYWEDLDLWWRLVEHGRILVVKEPLVQYRHSWSSSRARDPAQAFERSMEWMHREAEARSHSGPLGAPAEREAPAGARRIPRPRIFITRSWLAVWCGRRPGVLLPMLKRARMRPDPASLFALLFVAWATVSPRSLRFSVRAFLEARNAFARGRLAGTAVVEWRSRPAGTGARREGAVRYDRTTGPAPERDAVPSIAAGPGPGGDDAESRLPRAMNGRSTQR